jgi:hypothetical protein
MSDNPPGSLAGKFDTIRHNLTEIGRLMARDLRLEQIATWLNNRLASRAATKRRRTK